MVGKSGKEIPNQFIIDASVEGKSIIYFQSYNSVIVKKEHGKVYLDVNKWDYSKTTGKYRNQFLNESKKKTLEKIKNGTYTLVELN